MDDMSMKMGLLELYELVGDNRQVTFYYEDLPGILVTIGFTMDYEFDEELEEDDDDDNEEEEDNDSENTDGLELANKGTNGNAKRRKLH